MSLATWVKHAGNATRAAALRKLGKLPESETGHGAEVPWPFASREQYKADHSPDEIKKAIRAAPVVRLSLKDPKLHAIQHSVSPLQVARYIKDPDATKGRVNPKSRTPADIPVVIQYKGKKFLHDGHHRSVALLLRGKDETDVRFVDFDAKESRAA